GGYPQTPDVGGIVIMAQYSETGHKWMIGRGNTNLEQNSLFVNTYDTSLSEWSGWTKLLVEGSSIPTSSNSIPWDEIDKTKIVFNASATGAPGGISYHGLFINQGTTGIYGTKVLFR